MVLVVIAFSFVLVGIFLNRRKIRFDLISIRFSQLILRCTFARTELHQNLSKRVTASTRDQHRPVYRVAKTQQSESSLNFRCLIQRTSLFDEVRCIQHFQVRFQSTLVHVHRLIQDRTLVRSTSFHNRMLLGFCEYGSDLPTLDRISSRTLFPLQRFIAIPRFHDNGMCSSNQVKWISSSCKLDIQYPRESTILLILYHRKYDPWYYINGLNKSEHSIPTVFVDKELLICKSATESCYPEITIDKLVYTAIKYKLEHQTWTPNLNTKHERTNQTRPELHPKCSAIE